MPDHTRGKIEPQRINQMFFFLKQGMAIQICISMINRCKPQNAFNNTQHLPELQWVFHLESPAMSAIFKIGPLEGSCYGPLITLRLVLF